MNTVQQAVRILLYLSLQLLLGTFSFLHYCSSAIHGRLCRFLAFPPCKIYGPTQSAIVIVGGDDDLGRHIALKFSEQGYTVFALCPDRVPSVSSSQDASNVSSLIQEWHQRIKRSGHTNAPWGLVAPIVLDMTSSAQRTRAFETVDAYCATHSLHLVAVIVQPTRDLVSSKTGRAGMNISAWGEMVRERLVVPASIAQDYAPLLGAAYGRVVLLLTSGHQSWTPPWHTGIFLSAAQYLRQELDPFGITTSTVFVGPSAPVSNLFEPSHSETGAIASVSSQRGYFLGIRNTIEDVMPHFAVRNEDVWHVLRSIARSQYPKNNYDVGLHAKLQAMYWSLPGVLHLCLKFITPYFF